MKILIVEDNKICISLIKSNLQKYLLFVECDVVSSFEKLQHIKDTYDLFIVSDALADAKKDEHIEYLVAKTKNKKSRIILMAKFEDEKFKKKWSEKVVDILIKEDVVIYNYLIRLIKRVHKNQFLNVLVVDDSNTILEYVSKILKLLNFNIFKANNGMEALKVLEKKDMDLVVTDIEMPTINGVELVKKIRYQYKIDELPILVLSSTTNIELTFQILKFGANDFIKKPFEKEELIIRINNLLDLYDYLLTYKRNSLIDSLTDAYNRFYLEHELEKLLDLYPKRAIAMIDIDFFKKINDTYGHQKGDEVLKYFANLLKNNIRKNDVLIRYGGEEFLIFMPNTTKEGAYIVLTKIKKILENDKSKPLDFTFSAGISDEFDLLSELIRKADERLYKAKEEGRNKIVFK